MAEQLGQQGRGCAGLAGMAKLGGQIEEQEAPPMAATKKPRRKQGRDGNQDCNQALGVVIKGVVMRLRRRRLQPKAAAAPKRGRGPGTAAGPM